MPLRASPYTSSVFVLVPVEFGKHSLKACWLNNGMMAYPFKVRGS